MSGYQLISFLASQGIAWIMAWEYINSTYSQDIPYLARQIKHKWWKKFNVELLSKEKIVVWIKNNNQLESPKVENRKFSLFSEELFLQEKQKVIVELLSTISQEEFEERLKLIRSGQDKNVVE